MIFDRAAILLLLFLTAVQEKDPKPAASPLSHVAVIGASASAGFGIGPFPGGAVVLSQVAEASLGLKAGDVRNLSSFEVYSDMAGYATKTVAALDEDPPSAIVAIDYLFWCLHGPQKPAEREKLLASTLAGLEKFKCPILIGDIPDVTSSTSAPNPMMTKDLLPGAALRNEANSQVAAWAKKHANVVLVPFAAMVKKVNDGVEIQIRGNAWKAKEVGRLVQADKLHPTLEGLALAWITIADAWLKADKKLPEKSFDLKADKLLKTLEGAAAGKSK